MIRFFKGIAIGTTYIHHVENFSTCCVITTKSPFLQINFFLHCSICSLLRKLACLFAFLESVVARKWNTFCTLSAASS